MFVIKRFHVNKQKIIVVLILCAHLIVPSLFFVIFNQPSYALSMVVIACIVFILSIIFYGVQHPIQLSTGVIIFKYIVVLCLFVVTHLGLAYYMSGYLDFGRFYQSLLIAFFIIGSAYCSILIFSTVSDEIFKDSLGVIYRLIFIISMFSVILNYNPLSGIYSRFTRPVFPFIEPSHFALMIPPFLICFMVSLPTFQKRLFLIMFFLILLLFINNLTLVCVILMTSLIGFGIRKMIPLVLVVGIIFSVVDFNFDYYLSRVDTNKKEDNLSTLVWFVGWDEAIINFKDTNGLGVGFQQFGVKEPSGEITDRILFLFNDYLSRMDGGTTAAKVFGEFGVIGVCLLLFLLYKSIKSLLFLKKLSYGFNDIPMQLIFFHCCVGYFLIELFVRGLGYLAPGTFIYLVGLIGIEFYRRKGLVDEY
jgi:hypothetical protein